MKTKEMPSHKMDKKEKLEKSWNHAICTETKGKTSLSWYIDIAVMYVLIMFVEDTRWGATAVYYGWA